MSAVKTVLQTLTGRSWSEEGFATFLAAFVAGLFFIVMIQIHTLVQAQLADAPSGAAHSIRSDP